MAPNMPSAVPPQKGPSSGDRLLPGSKQDSGGSSLPLGNATPKAPQNNTPQVPSSGLFGRPIAPMIGQNKPFQANSGGLLGGKSTGTTIPQAKANIGGPMGPTKPPILPAAIQTSKPSPLSAGGKLNDGQKPSAKSAQPKPLPPTQATVPSQGVSTKPIATANNPLQTKGQTPPKPQDKDNRAFFGMFGGSDNTKPTVPASQDGRKIPQEKKTQPSGGIFGSGGSGNKSSTLTSNQNGSRGGAAGATNFGKPEYKKQGPSSVMTDSKGKGKPPAMPKVAPKAKANSLIVYVDGKRTIL